MMQILINAYAVNPDWGSEPGMGWNWVIHLACLLYTSLSFRGRQASLERHDRSANAEQLKRIYGSIAGEAGNGTEAVSYTHLPRPVPDVHEGGGREDVYGPEPGRRVCPDREKSPSP